MEIVGTEQARRLVEAGAQVVEVLPESDYRIEHLPGAVCIPLPMLDQRTAGQLDRHRPVVVYCYDLQCDLSGRAAALLDRFGFDEVYDYAESKAAWLAMGLPSEGSRSQAERVVAHARPATTCTPDCPMGQAPPPGPGGVVVVVDADGVVLGSIHGDRRGASTAPVSDVMSPGPATVRPSMTVDELARSMRRSGETHVLVSTLHGKLLGVVTREDIRVDR